MENKSKTNKSLNRWLKTLLNYASFGFYEAKWPFSFEIQAKITTTSWQFEHKISYLKQ